MKPESPSNCSFLLSSSSFPNLGAPPIRHAELTDLGRGCTRLLSKWPEHLVIVRHAQSERNVRKDIATANGDFIYGGETRDIDVGLTTVGEKQAIATGKALGQQFRFDRLFASPFRRTIQTARIIAKQFRDPLELLEDDRLREIDFGILDGLTKQGIAHFQPGEMERRARLGKLSRRRAPASRLPRHAHQRDCRTIGFGRMSLSRRFGIPETLGAALGETDPGDRCG
jgi:hypothetical protein